MDTSDSENEDVDLKLQFELEELENKSKEKDSGYVLPRTEEVQEEKYLIRKEGQKSFYIKNSSVNSEKIQMQPVDVKERNIKCNECGALRWPLQPSTICCEHGNIKLKKITAVPDCIKNLLNGTDERSKFFKKHILRFGNALAMSSAGMKPHFPYKSKKHKPTFMIQGVPHHRIGALLPTKDEQAEFVQIFFIDTEEATTRRTHFYDALNTTMGKSILNELQVWLRKNNRHIRRFETAIERQSKNQHQNLKIVFKDAPPRGQHKRKWNPPRCKQVCGLITNLQPKKFQKRDLIVFCKESGQRKRINETHKMHDPLHYVILFPHGDTQWDLHHKTNKDKRLTCKQYYKYRLRFRKDQADLFKAGPVFHKFIIDMYSKALLQDLRFYELKQDKINADAYQRINAKIKTKDGLKKRRKRTILPPTYRGSNRFIKSKFLDLQAISRHFHGPPTYFITMTCNPSWPEITAALGDGETAEDRPDVVVDVFQMKLKLLMIDLTEHHVLGKCVAHYFVNEYQKLGKPHAHILLWLAAEDKPRSVQDVERLVSCEVPDPEENSRLHELVGEYMIHTPCQSHHECFDSGRNHPCLSAAGKCTKFFPKAYSMVTDCTDNKFAKLKRIPPSEGGHVFKKSKTDETPMEVGAEWVVQYNPKLLLKHMCHINVEIVDFCGVIKYTVKYVTKGHDMATFELTPNDQDDDGNMIINEIKEFKNGRYIGAYEAYTGLIGQKYFPNYVNYPPVEILNLHLKNKKITLPEEGDEEAEENVCEIKPADFKEQS